MQIFRQIKLLRIAVIALSVLMSPLLLHGENSLDKKVVLSSNDTCLLREKLDNGYRAFILSDQVPDEKALADLRTFLKNNPGEIITLILQHTDKGFLTALDQSPVKAYIATPEEYSLDRLDECIKRDKRLLLFTPDGSSLSYASKEHICNYSIPQGFPEVVSSGFDDDPINSLMIFNIEQELKNLPDSLSDKPELIPELFNRLTGKLPNFFVSKDKNIYLSYKEKFEQQKWYTAEAEYNGKLLTEVRWMELPGMVSYGKIHTTQIILSPYKDGFHFSPDIFTFNDETSGTTKIFFARQRDLLDEMVLHLNFNQNFVNQVNDRQQAPFGNIAYKKDSSRGWCADFNGANHYIDFEKEIVFDENFTLSVWLHPTEIGGDRSIIGKGEALSIKIRNEKMLYTSPGIKDHASDSTLVSPHNWQHLTYVISSGQTVKFYKNGKLIESQKAERIEPTQHSLLVGTNLWDESFKGQMDELIIWNRNLSDEEIMRIYKKGIDHDTTKNSKKHVLVFAIAFLLLLISYFSFKKKSKTRTGSKLKTGYDLSNSIQNRIEAPSIEFFGGFKLINRSKEELTARFSPRRKQILILVLIKTLTEKGITSKQLTNHLWAGHTLESAKNNRSTQVQRIRETLALNSGIHISYADKKWIIELEKDVYCDLAEYFQLFEELKQAQSGEMNFDLLAELLTIVEKGPLLPNMDDEWLDNFKSKVSDELLDLLFPLFEDHVINDKPDWIIRLSRALLIFDPLNESLLEYNIRALVKIGKNTMANESLEHFEKVYLQCYDQAYNKTITEIIG